MVIARGTATRRHRPKMTRGRTPAKSGTVTDGVLRKGDKPTTAGLRSGTTHITGAVRPRVARVSMRRAVRVGRLPRDRQGSKWTRRRSSPGWTPTATARSPKRSSSKPTRSCRKCARRWADHSTPAWVPAVPVEVPVPACGPVVLARVLVPACGPVVLARVLVPVCGPVVLARVLVLVCGPVVLARALVPVCGPVVLARALVLA